MKDQILPPSFLVIFGITGDLSKKKLLPALYHLLEDNSLPETFKVVGVSRHDVDIDKLLSETELCILDKDNICKPNIIKKLKSCLTIFSMDLTDGQEYKRLIDYLNKEEETLNQCMNRLYYLSIPPQVFGPIVRFLGEYGHNSGCQHNTTKSRLLVEKPFGFDLTSAKELIHNLDASFGDHQVFRIDHYVAKETVQNILTFRFQNPIFEAVWSSDNISHIIISATETIGIEGRVTFYEQTGALRDLIQSHLLQLLAIVTMDKPKSFDSQDIHTEKLKALNSVQTISPDKVSKVSIRGQYDGYLKEVSDSHSLTETYAAVKLSIDSGRLKDTPIIIQTGKGLKDKKTEIVIVFKHSENKDAENRLVLRIQPNEGITLFLKAKEPGLKNKTKIVEMNFDYNDTFKTIHPDAYERVLVDAIKGDQTLFSTSAEVLSAWKIIEPILSSWSKNNASMQTYNIGTTGPSLYTKFLSEIDIS
ncbi:MAG: glucose-6-phosphate dehydrogenase [Candidatus Saccharimonadales bacterium]